MSTSIIEQITHLPHEQSVVVTFLLASGLAWLVGLVARFQMSHSNHLFSDRFNLSSLFDYLVEFIDNLAINIIGPEGRHYVPFFASLFYLILFNNLLGLVPGLVPATENFNTTLALGLISFIFYNWQALKHQGLGYIKHLVGPVFWLAPLMLIIEVISHLVRPLSLGLRLANVLRGDHTVLEIFAGLVPWVVPIIFLTLGAFVSFVQAFVFTLLSMVYVSLAISHDH